jgi:hypothetical protein
MMMGVELVLVFLGAVANEFIRNQWERKGLNTFISMLNAIWDQRPMPFILP